MSQQARLGLRNGKFSRHPTQKVLFQRDAKQSFDLFPGTIIRIIQRFVMNRKSTLQLFHKSYRIIKTDISIKSCPPGQNLMCFHFMPSRIQQSNDVRIGRIFL